MASYNDLENEWKMCIKDDPSLWTESDLQLAAELGKTLLERNKELENALKHTQTIVEDQLQEIEYLTKQSVALREVNDSRMRIYEQLEVSIHDLERANHRLVLENAAEKKRVKSLAANIENLESKNEDLLTTIDELRLQTDILKRKLKRSTEVTPIQSPNLQYQGLRHVDATSPQPNSTNDLKASTPKTPNDDCNRTDDAKIENGNGEPVLPAVDDDDCQGSDNMEEVSKLLTQLREFKTQCAKEQRKVAELEEQLATVSQQNHVLENQVMKLHHKDEDVKSVHEEFSLLEEVRQGQTCSRCLRNMDSPEQREVIEKPPESPQNIPEDDDSSMLEALMNDTPPSYVSVYALNVQDYPKTPQNNTKQPKNHYKEFVEKYEALFEDHHHNESGNKEDRPKEQFASLQEELRNSGEYAEFSHRDHDEDEGDLDKHHNKKAGKAVSHTPTDFSEAETSSSGFADETSTKSTQTDGMGSLLCAIQDGDDCKFSIYDEMSPIDSRFRKRPEYRELFKEIFEVLKKAADNKYEVPESANSSMCVEPSDAIMNDYPDDDTESIQSSTVSFPVSLSHQSSIVDDGVATLISTSDQPSIMSEISTEENEEQKPQEPVLRPLIRQSLDYLHVESRKRSSSRRKHRQQHHSADQRSDSPVTHIIGSPKISYSSRPSSGRRRRELRNALQQQQAAAASVDPPNAADITWNGNSMQFWASNRAGCASPTPSQGSEKAAYEFKPSVASQEIKKLKSLDKSYAEVLKLGEGRGGGKRHHRATKGTSQHR